MKKGSKMTEEQKAKLKGRIPWNKGLTSENNEKLKSIGKNISASLKGKSTWNKDIKGEEYLKHFQNNQIWNKNLTKEQHPSLLIISQQKKGENNPQWKGDKVGYISLHEWIKTYKPKPKVCENCKDCEPHDLANISGKYQRNIKDFKWLCRRCHMKEDGRMNNLKQYQKEVITIWH